MSKILFISGAEKKIGRSIALQAAEEGHKLILHSYNEDALSEVIEEIEKLGASYLSSAFSLYDIDGFTRVVDIAKQKFGRIDAFINAEGIMKSGNLWEMETDEFEKMLKVNLTGVFNAIKTIVPIMIQQKSGDLVNVLSTAGKRARENWAGYSATMFAVRGMAHALAQEVKQYGIRVINIFPDFIEQMERGVEETIESDKLLKPEDVAQTVLNSVMLHRRAVISEMELFPSSFN